MKVTPPERAMVRELARGFWATSEQIARAAGVPVSKVTAKMRRLRGLGMVECMDASGGKRYRLTADGERWKADHLATRWVALEGTGIDARTATVRHRDTHQLVHVHYPYDPDPTTSAKWGVTLSDGAFDWVPSYVLEVLA